MPARTEKTAIIAAVIMAALKPLAICKAEAAGVVYFTETALKSWYCNKKEHKKCNKGSLTIRDVV